MTKKKAKTHDEKIADVAGRIATRAGVIMEQTGIQPSQLAMTMGGALGAVVLGAVAKLPPNEQRRIARQILKMSHMFAAGVVQQGTMDPDGNLEPHLLEAGQTGGGP